MGKVFVQFSDESQARVSSVFGCGQDPDTFPNQGEIDDDDARYTAFLLPPIPEIPIDPLDKLKAFLTDNPDVAAILE